MISTVGQNDAMSKVNLSEFPSQKELMEKELEGRSRGNQCQIIIISVSVQHTVFRVLEEMLELLLLEHYTLLSQCNQNIITLILMQH